MLKVLVPIDSSAFSLSVLEYIKKLLSPQHYRLTLLEVVPIPEALRDIKPGVSATWAARMGYDLSSEKVSRVLESDRSAYVEGIWKRYEHNVLDKMEKAKQDLEQAGFMVDTLARFGDPANEISHCANYGHMDLVIMATHARSGMGLMVMGSVAEKVLRSLHIPVMMIRPEFVTPDEWTPVSDVAEVVDAFA